MDSFNRPYKSMEELRQLSPYKLSAQKHFHLASGRVAYLNERHCREKLNSVGIEYCPRATSAWLKRCGAVLSEPQLKADFLFPELQPREACVGYRPPRYGRAAIFETRHSYPDAQCAEHEDALLLDVKGCGVASGAQALPGRSTSGLLSLHLALTEVINAQLIDFVFRDQGYAVRCVPILGVVDLGFWSHSADGSAFPCATLVRQVHIRPPSNNELPLAGSIEEAVKDEIEHNLFRAGLTSTGYSTLMAINFESDRLVLRIGGEDSNASEDHLWELMRRHNVNPPLVIFLTNVQIAHSPGNAPLSAEIVDLSHYKSFVPPPSFVATPVDDRPFNLSRLSKREVVRDPGHPKLDLGLLCDRVLCEDPQFETIRRAFPIWRQPFMRVSGAVVEALRIASQFHLGEIDTDGVTQQVDNFVRSCTRGFSGSATRDPASIECWDRPGHAAAGNLAGVGAPCPSRAPQ
jgi:hypothetical protein